MSMLPYFWKYTRRPTYTHMCQYRYQHTSNDKPETHMNKKVNLDTSKTNNHANTHVPPKMGLEIKETTMNMHNTQCAHNADCLTCSKIEYIFPC